MTHQLKKVVSSIFSFSYKSIKLKTLYILLKSISISAEYSFEDYEHIPQVITIFIPVSFGWEG